MKLYLANIPELLTRPAEFYLSMLPPGRAASAARLKVESARLRSVCAGLLLRAVFGPEDPARTALDKPYFPGKAPFSLSHAGNWAVLAVGGASVGVDVEQVRKADFRLARRFFHPAEYAWLSACPDPDTAFTQIWTYKEAFLKALGTGLTVRPNSFCLPRPGLPLLHEGENWYFMDVELPGYALTLCDRDKAPAPDLVFCSKRFLGI